ncbi:hypothetical protein Desku_0559 [Desulfofundulus kuznetsovii DSM 6115]|jgi:hypothetical protein|uniref:Uncharacterized protein n=1 Tax=Desulfofundulus kuznetsovii (strain DSM 6115 / VKM B-1805 / 17) TaxID=760568 RepID=A0AAU8P8Q5_DESK7|nr:hypothetical protein Desku_0559 [Desulfofundulus kuznetsovii DSM 6115]
MAPDPGYYYYGQFSFILFLILILLFFGKGFFPYQAQ